MGGDELRGHRPDPRRERRQSEVRHLSRAPVPARRTGEPTMTCPHLEETSALFDGRDIDRTHADSCDECRAFLADAAQLREALGEVTFAAPRRRVAPILVPVALMLCLVLIFFLRTNHTEDT